MRTVDLIAKKRAGQEHTFEEISYLISGLKGQETNGRVKDYQLAAWLMAVCWQGMSLDETAYLTDCLARSGKVLDLSEIGPIVGDKHSTGGVGDKTTLVFVPLLAAAGIPMAKLSGRGLGHTGGTIDKLEAIPGFKTELSVLQFIKQVKEIGCAIASQTQDLAPADGKLYAMRDVTATVESIPLICASVMSKKIAAGANLIILDVKCGAGAFMETEKEACYLARVMAEVGERLGRPVTAVVTDMEQPLGFAVGHSLEVREAIETLKGNGPPDLNELVFGLGALALVKAGKATDAKQAEEILAGLVRSGQALAKFKELISAQNGDPSVVDNPALMPFAPYVGDVLVPGQRTKWISQLNGKKIAEACKIMGGGRSYKGEKINLASGVVLAGKIGSRMEGGSKVATIYADNEAQYRQALAIVNEAIVYSHEPQDAPPVIKAKISV